jgi:hypothetical protein
MGAQNHGLKSNVAKKQAKARKLSKGKKKKNHGIYI